MKTTAKKKLAVSPSRVRKPSCLVRIHPEFAELFTPADAKTPSSRIANGAAGSHAAAALGQCIQTMRRAFTVRVEEVKP